VGYNKLIIFAGNYQQACDWAYEHGFRRRDAFMYPEDAYQLRGRRNAQAIIVGTFWDTRRPEMIEEMLQVAKYLNYKWVDEP
jgi:hypothetical protein